MVVALLTISAASIGSQGCRKQAGDSCASLQSARRPTASPAAALGIEPEPPPSYVLATAMHCRRSQDTQKHALAS